MRPIALAALSLTALLAAGCGARTVMYTFHRSGIDDIQAQRDKSELEDVDGVEGARLQYDAIKRSARIELLMEEGEELPGSEKARALGYVRSGN